MELHNWIMEIHDYLWSSMIMGFCPLLHSILSGISTKTINKTALNKIQLMNELWPKDMIEYIHNDDQIIN